MSKTPCFLYPGPMYLGRNFLYLCQMDLDRFTKNQNNNFFHQKKLTLKMDTVIVFASIETITLLEDGERVPTKVAQTKKNYHIDSYTKEWYETKRSALEAFGLSDYTMLRLLDLALRATVDNLMYARKAARTSLRKQRISLLTEKEIDTILNLLF